ncbi:MULTISPECIES: MurR/RpiR family transcriptional regulator [unclassified Mesorhizobium]|uniref:MurR/RpiR family transcriptional regulator n=1 Tax=unclassified Mesorhizobium TaxID=325217 RepID=UPI0003CE80F4|nr:MULTISPECIES: MurR/RpiR family transcriptional regulator [unclassified Mesorhizobium]ESY18751.1 transcriptional regulator [Mesorhizobium sp. LNJC395A00]WJI78256.1 MurR/RpiR family transcriptional regulator [Mesorhizobium sp. C395A]
MEQGPLTEEILNGLNGMPEQMQNAARFVLDRPRDVALLSMRKQARLAGVQPSTMTRLAKHLGLGGFDNIRNMYAEALRDAAAGRPGRIGKPVAMPKLKGDLAVVAEMLKSIARQVTQLAEPRSLERVVTAAVSLAKARRIYCLGLRSSHAIAWQLQYILRLVGEKSVFLDGIGGTGSDAIVSACKGDVLLVASVYSYTRTTVQLTKFAKSRGISVVAITDSEVAPLALIAETTVVVPTNGLSFFNTMTPAFAIAEVLGALIAGHGGDEALEAIERYDKQLAALNIHLKPRISNRRL